MVDGRVIATLAVLLHAVAAEPPDFCRLNVSFKVWDAPGTCSTCRGKGAGSVVAGAGASCDGVNMTSADGMAASFMTSAFPITPSVVYNVSWDVWTSELTATTAYFTGGIYVQFFDAKVPPGASGESTYGDGWYPGFGPQEKGNTNGWAARSMLFSAPTTAKFGMLHMAFAAHTTGYVPDRLHGGSARGSVQIKNVELVETSESNSPAAVRIDLPAHETKLKQAIGMMGNCFHDSSLTGNFTVGSDYIISGNLSPDLGMGIFGVRRLGTPDMMKLYTEQWKFETIGGVSSGEIKQRVMAQSWWPLGVDNAFSFSGDTEFLKAQLPIVDRSLEWSRSKYDKDGLFLCHKGAGAEGSDCGGPGMDWVDWSVSRASGKTFNFQLWHAFTLRRIAQLHEEFSSDFGNATLAGIYVARADRIEKVLKEQYWIEAGEQQAHWATNFPGLFEDELWFDDQVWSNYFGLSTPSQAAVIFDYLAEDPGGNCSGKGAPTTCSPEGVPTKWNNRTRHGRDAETWFGRNGAPNIMARFADGQGEHARQLLARIAQVFVDSGNIYESYDMAGKLGGDPGANYLEHCGGFSWAITEGLFGIEFFSDGEAAATIRDPLSRLDPTWPSATIAFVLRGTDVTLTVMPSTKQLKLRGRGPKQSVRVVSGGQTQVIVVGTGYAEFHHQTSVKPFTIIPHKGTLPVPTKQQLAYQGEISALIHFGMATFFHDGDPGCDANNWRGCDPKGGCNSSDVASFNPTNLNVSAWVQSFKDLGATSAVLTAKHGCGFLGWKTKTMLPDGSPYRYHVPDHLNVVEQFVSGAEAAGIGHGFYYSLTNNFYLNVAGHNARPASTALPGQAIVTQEQYEALALEQVTELWTQFGNLTEIWLDGGCGSMCDKVGALVKTTNAKNAVAFNGGGVSDSPVRWCGTEGGSPKRGVGGSVWSTSDCTPSWCPAGSGSGSPPNTTGSTWYPSGVDVTLQSGDHWFFTPGDALNPLSTLIGMYHNSVGANGHLEVDFAISRTGGVDPKHAVAYSSFGSWIRSCYGTPVAQGELPNQKSSFEISFVSTVIDRVRMEENQSNGQLIVDYIVEAKVGPRQWVPFSSGVAVGAKRIDIAAAPVTASGLRFSASSGFAMPTGLKLFAFAPGPCAAKQFEYPL